MSLTVVLSVKLFFKSYIKRADIRDEKAYIVELPISIAGKIYIQK